MSKSCDEGIDISEGALDAGPPNYVGADRTPPRPVGNKVFVWGWLLSELTA